MIFLSLKIEVGLEHIMYFVSIMRYMASIFLDTVSLGIENALTHQHIRLFK